jgi:hypothetical protein
MKVSLHIEQFCQIVPHYPIFQMNELLVDASVSRIEPHLYFPKVRPPLLAPIGHGSSVTFQADKTEPKRRI